jgi:hypothetical protein
MHRLRAYFRAYARRKHVRPWALASPVLILLFCLPLLRPLRHPLPGQMNDDEMSRLATIQALVEQQTFAIDQTQFAATRQKIRVGEASYSDQPPVMGLLLSGPYWLMHHAGYSFKNNPYLIEYLLTLLASTVPVAAAAGMIYRMGRLFELGRPWRAGLALSVVLGSGLISYATVLNPYAPAAALVLLSAAILVQVSIVNSPLRSGGYLISAGFFAALAAAIDPAAVVFTILFIAVVSSMRWRWSMRIGGVLMYIIGMIPPVLLHVALSVPITGDGRLGLAPLPARTMRVIITPIAAIKPSDSDEDLVTAPPTIAQLTGIFMSRLTAAFLGPHGLLTHFPVLILGIAGVAAVCHRHWPWTTKSLAIITVAGSLIVILRYVWLPVDWKWAMFGVRWYVVFLPLVLFWAGAWIRRNHHPATWAVAGVLLAFSAIVSLIGAMDPMPREGYERYTPAAALRTFVNPQPSTELSQFAGR